MTRTDATDECSLMKPHRARNRHGWSTASETPLRNSSLTSDTSRPVSSLASDTSRPPSESRWRYLYPRLFPMTRPAVDVVFRCSYRWLQGGCSSLRSVHTSAPQNQEARSAGLLCPNHFIPWNLFPWGNNSP